MSVPVDYVSVHDRMLAVLSDGERHARDELYACLQDDLSSLATLRVQVSHLRKKLKEQGKFLNSYIEYVSGQNLISYQIVPIPEG